MPYTEAQKRATYKWMNKNKDYVLQYSRDHGRRRYKDENVREAKIQKVLDKYYFKKELKIFLKILISEI